jgi:DNA mismatch endonuclease (patch repair protein)
VNTHLDRSRERIERTKRSSIMRAVRGKNTRPEMIVRRAAHSLGLRFRLHAKGLPGRPDLVFPRWKTVVFVHGCFWHRHEGCRLASTPKSNVAFWQAKFRANVKRDGAIDRTLTNIGWRVIVLWQCQIKTREVAVKALRAAFHLTD